MSDSRTYKCLVVLLLLSGAGSTLAEEQTPLLFEATLSGGLRFGGEFDNVDPNASKHKIDSGGSFGLTLNLEQDEGAYYELTYSKQAAEVKNNSALDLDIEYLHLGGYVEFGERWKFVPYFAMTFGLTRFSPEVGGYDDVTEPSLAIGTGMKFPLSKNFALRADLRGYVTFVDSNSDLFCLSSGAGLTCAVNIQGDSFFQAQATIGVTLGF